MLLHKTILVSLFSQKVKSERSVVTLSLVLPADFPVGSYRIVAEVVPEGSKQGEKKDADRELVVLFNPWSSGMPHLSLNSHC